MEEREFVDMSELGYDDGGVGAGWYTVVIE